MSRTLPRSLEAQARAAETELRSRLPSTLTVEDLDRYAQLIANLRLGVHRHRRSIATYLAEEEEPARG